MHNFINFRLMKKESHYLNGPMFMTSGIHILLSSYNVMVERNWKELVICLNNVLKTVLKNMPKV